MGHAVCYAAGKSDSWELLFLYGNSSAHNSFWEWIEYNQADFVIFAAYTSINHANIF